MKKKLKIYSSILLLLITIVVACKKNIMSSHGEGVNSNKTEKMAHSVEQLHAETVILTDFNNALEGAPTASINDLASPAYQSTLAYENLSNASVALLAQSDILDSLKFHLNITTNTDPRLILAARLINEMVMFPPDSLSSSSVPPWVNCIVTAGIGISINSIYALFEGGTLAAVGQAIKHMGYSWFAKTVGGTFAKVLTGAGGAIMVAQFTWCIWKEYGSQAILDVGLEPLIDAIPTSFFNQNKSFWDFHKTGFMNYMAINNPLVSVADCEYIYNYVYESTGDPQFIGTNFVRDYFSSISASPLPVLN